MKGDSESNLVKIYFYLEQDDDGYPPVATESLWARELQDNMYCIDNIPFYAKGVSLNDIVTAKPNEENLLFFRKIIQPSGHSTIRVIIFEDADVSSWQHELEKFGCASEKDYLPQLISVDIPPTVDIQNVWALLEEGLHNDQLEYEDACIQHKNDKWGQSKIKKVIGI
ncbi:MAG: DUF4265 domain-containing protein [Methylococcaceae bacterium]|nr:DUF4265 domain-containing protein [Methylococcaceae bacterium]